ncbi:hypothetical protein B0T19DRAFT_476142 [Cercophora scortea]|uniref:Uncharacterized protein n=1 Tax=Cercophora scortea TaxID=314031 RepID=A0AAE0IPI2_9PEZI|nr:hypothetical protein B0T19DRAFT_476142 [Cercophora scortea]
MASHLLKIWVCLAVVVLHAAADIGTCTCTGIDYSNDGSYLVDGSDTSNFAFTSVFQSCDETDTIEPILVDPNGRQYNCTTLQIHENGKQQSSSCDIAYSQMSSGSWTIVLQADNVNFQAVRKFRLTVTAPDKVTITITPTVVIGVTSTAPAATTTTTLTQTSLAIGTPKTVTNHCGGSSTQTVTRWLPAPISTIDTTIYKTQTDGPATTEYYLTTIGATASCHYAQGQAPSVPRPDTTPKPSARAQDLAEEEAEVLAGLEGVEVVADQDLAEEGAEVLAGLEGVGVVVDRVEEAVEEEGGASVPDPARAEVEVVVVEVVVEARAEEAAEEAVEEVEAEEVEVEVAVVEAVDMEDARKATMVSPVVVEVREVAKAAAITSTIFETTYTVTSTETLLAPAPTTVTETAYDGVTRTFIPPAQTVCDQPDLVTLTVLSAQPTQTEYDVSLVTIHTIDTVWVRQTQYTTYTNRAAETACWAVGGQYGV